MVSCSHTTFLLSFGLMIIYRASGEDCDTEEIGVAMLSCQEEREMLSDASRHNDTAQLCQALQQYSECIGPKIVGCKGEALMAFNVIKQQYAGEPYNCHITESWNDDGDFQNDVNSQLHDDDADDNHIVTNGPGNDVDDVTEPALPGKTEPVKNEEPPKQKTKTTTPAVPDSKQEGNQEDPTNTAISTCATPISFFSAALVFTILSLTLQVA